MRAIDWQTLLLYSIALLGIVLGPYEMLMLLQRLWEKRRAERIARGEDVRPQKLPWDYED